MTDRLLIRAGIIEHPTRAEVTVSEGTETRKGFTHQNAPCAFSS